MWALARQLSQTCCRVAARRDGPVTPRAPPAITGRVAIRCWRACC